MSYVWGSKCRQHSHRQCMSFHVRNPRASPCVICSCMGSNNILAIGLITLDLCESYFRRKRVFVSISFHSTFSDGVFLWDEFTAAVTVSRCTWYDSRFIDTCKYKCFQCRRPFSPYPVPLAFDYSAYPSPPTTTTPLAARPSGDPRPWSQCQDEELSLIHI